MGNIHAGLSFGQFFAFFTRIGFTSFGGPAGQIALMHREIVDEKKWLSEDDFLHALNFCHLLPGPEAQQLATYIGWKLKGILGGIVAGLLFILPGAIIVLGLTILYAFAADLSWFQAMFMGIKAAVLAIVAQALIRISGRALKSNFDKPLAISAFVGLFFFNLPFPIIIIAAAIFGFLFANNTNEVSPIEHQTKAPIREKTIQSLKAIVIWGSIWAIPFILMYLTIGKENTFWEIGVFFSKLAVVTFGGAYAVLAYMAQEAVQTFGWLSAGEMANGLGLAETTPGPLILVTQFVGYLAAFRAPGPFTPLTAGLIGALITTWVTFAPCFLWIFAFAPWLDDLKKSIKLKASLAAITASIVGVIANLSFWFALHVVFTRVGHLENGIVKMIVPEWQSFDWKSTQLVIICAILLFKTKIGTLRLLLVSAIVGLLLGLAI